MYPGVIVTVQVPVVPDANCPALEPPTAVVREHPVTLIVPPVPRSTRPVGKICVLPNWLGIIVARDRSVYALPQLIPLFIDVPAVIRFGLADVALFAQLILAPAPPLVSCDSKTFSIPPALILIFGCEIAVVRIECPFTVTVEVLARLTICPAMVDPSNTAVELAATLITLAPVNLVP